MNKAYTRYLLIALAVIVADQLIKLLVKTQMELNESINVIGNVFKIHFIENPGAAFGMTLKSIGINDETDAKLVLTVFSILAVIAIAYYLYRISSLKTKLPLYVAIILGGAIGNIIDRVFYGIWFGEMNVYEGGLLFGRVVDMFYIDIWTGTLPDWLGGGEYSFWPIFNLADAAISVGIVAILIWQKRLFGEKKGKTPPAEQVA